MSKGQKTALVATACTAVLCFCGFARAEQAAGNEQEEVSPTQPVVETPVAESTQPVPAATDWVDKAKHPLPWLSWGFDERLRQEYLNNVFNLNEKGPNREWNFGRYRSRLWTTISPMKELDLNVRLMWESRYWFKPEDVPARSDYQANNLVIDSLNFKSEKPLWAAVDADGRPTGYLPGRRLAGCRRYAAGRVDDDVL